MFTNTDKWPVSNTHKVEHDTHLDHHTHTHTHTHTFKHHVNNEHDTERNYIVIVAVKAIPRIKATCRFPLGILM